MIRDLWVPLAVTCGVGGCAAATAESGAPEVERHVISQAEIDAAPVSNAWELVRRLRPEYLRPYRRVPSGLSPDAERHAVLYVDGIRWGSVGELSRLPVADLMEVRYLPGAEATTRFGIGHAAGAIIVKTRQG